MTKRDEQIDAYLEANLDGYVAETARYCSQPSVSARNEGTRECSVLVAQILAEHGFAVQTFETAGNPVVVGQLDGKSERRLLFYNHYDVQPPEPLDLWVSPPFEPEVRNGVLYARGSKDDKGELIARLAAIDAVREAHGGELPCGAIFVVEGQEEVGSPHIAQFVQENLQLLKSDGALWEEGGIDPSGTPGMSLGLRGILYIELAAKTMSIDAHSGGAHALPNAAWRLLWALQTLKDRDERILIPGFYDKAKPASARDEELFDLLPDYEEWLREAFGVTEFVRDMHGRDLDRAVFNPTCNIAGLTAGFQGEGMKTVIPARATAKIDFRLVPDQDPMEIFALLRQHLDDNGFSDIELTRLGTMWPYRTDPDDPLVKLARDTGEEVYGKPSQVDPMSGGSSPAYAFGLPLNIPVIEAGVGYGNNQAHAPNEHLRLVDLLNAARHIGRIFDRFADL